MARREERAGVVDGLRSMVTMSRCHGGHPSHRGHEVTPGHQSGVETAAWGQLRGRRGGTARVEGTCYVGRVSVSHRTVAGAIRDSGDGDGDRDRDCDCLAVSMPSSWCLASAGGELLWRRSGGALSRAAALPWLLAASRSSSTRPQVPPVPPLYPRDIGDVDGGKAVAVVTRSAAKCDHQVR